MLLLLAYSLRNLQERKLTNLLTATGMALVVFVYAAVLMLDSGLEQTLVATGEDTNVIFVRQARIIESQPEIITGAEGVPVVSKDRRPVGFSDYIGTGAPKPGMMPIGSTAKTMASTVRTRTERRVGGWSISGRRPANSRNTMPRSNAMATHHRIQSTPVRKTGRINTRPTATAARRADNASLNRAIGTPDTSAMAYMVTASTTMP